MVQGSFKISKISSKGVSKMLYGRFKGVRESVKCVSRKFHKKFQGCFKNLSMKCCSMNLIAATRAEGGLVHFLPKLDL